MRRAATGSTRDRAERRPKFLAWRRIGIPRALGLLSVLGTGGAGAEDLFAGGTGAYAIYREPVLCVAGDGIVLVFSEGSKKANPGTERGEVVLRRSEDAGRTWSEESPVRVASGPESRETGPAPSQAVWGPVCVTGDARGGGVHLLYTSGGGKQLFHTVSADAGRSWGPPVEITGVLAETPFPWTEILTGPGQGIARTDGALLAPLTLQRSGLRHEILEIDAGRYRALVLMRRPGRARWEPSRLVGPWLRHLREGSLADVGPHQILYHLKGTELGGRAESRSADGGRTWRRPELIKDLDCADFRGGLVRLPGEELPALLLSGSTVAPKAELVEAGSEAEQANSQSTEDTGLPAGKLFLGGWISGRPGTLRTRVLEEEGVGASDLAATANGDVLCVFERVDGGLQGSVGIRMVSRAEIQSLVTGR
ncbi:MAG TPA: sialidase family protein [Verrucomicrobiales bacterium]|nr:sialidase family protein [Verrucomicrobiales bacterium]